MNTREQIKEYLIKNPSAIDRTKPGCYLNIAKMFNSDSEIVRGIHRKLRKQGIVEKGIPQPSKAQEANSIVVKGDNAEITKIVVKQVKTLED